MSEDLVRSLKKAGAFTALIFGMMILVSLMIAAVSFVAQFSTVLGVVVLIAMVFIVIFVVDFFG
jgi:hypothetical protein